MTNLRDVANKMNDQKRSTTFYRTQARVERDDNNWHRKEGTSKSNLISPATVGEFKPDSYVNIDLYTYK